MEKFTIPLQENTLTLSEKFKQHFPNGEISEIKLTEIPEDILELFKNKYRALVSQEKQQPFEMSRFRKISHTDGSISYAATVTKHYDGETGTEESTYIADVHESELSGYGELRKNLTNNSDYFKDKPFVGFTKTENKFLRSDLALRRLYLMNAIAQSRYGQPVYSDTVISDEARELWENLVEQGKATKFKQGLHERYQLNASK